MEELMSAGITVDQLSALLAGGLIGAIFTISAIGGVLSFIYNVLSIIGGWKIYKKFGEPGWKCIIPFYNVWVEYKYTWNTKMAVWNVALSLAGGVIMQIAAEGNALWYLGFAAFLAGWIISVMGYSKLSKAFGKGTGFTVGLVLLTGLFEIILGFGKSEYIGNSTEIAADKAE